MKLTTITLLLLLLGILSCSKNEENLRIDRNCADYASQAAAQLDFDRYPECRSDLDADGDGIACEDWAHHYQSTGGGSSGSGSSGGGCPNTSACGCSNHNKTPCQSDPCCRWTVGEGCGCR